MSEPIISINGHLLNAAQSITMRGALEIFASYLDENSKELGEIGPLYKLRIAEIRSMIFNHVSNPDIHD